LASSIEHRIAIAIAIANVIDDITDILLFLFLHFCIFGVLFNTWTAFSNLPRMTRVDK